MVKKSPIIFSTAFANYTVTRLIAAGGSGKVFGGQSDLAESLAVKVLDPAKATSSKRKRFKNELNFCSRTNHANVLKVLDWGVCDIDDHSTMFYVMPYFPTTLRTLMNERIPTEQALAIFASILHGVECAHLHNVVHRDLKPENVLWDSDSKVPIVADFGIAQFAEEDLYTAIETRLTDRLANFQYSAPEQRVRGRNVNHTADIYALGLLLNEMYTGEILQGTGYKTIADIDPSLSYLDEIVSKMVKQDPRARFQSIDAVKQELEVRGKEFIARQQLDKLKNTVVRIDEITDPLVTDPITLTGIDYRAGELILHLSKSVTERWVEAFRNGGAWTTAAPPEAFRFSRDKVYIQIAHPNYAKEIVKWFQSRYLPNATERYKEWVRMDQAEQDRIKKEELKRAIKEEETRMQILNNVKFE